MIGPPDTARVRLDWRTRPVLHHREGCRLCCTLRITKTPGSPPRHPDNCPRCGPSHPRPRPDLCWLCRTTAHLRDDHGRPVHKTCLEHAIGREAAEPRKDTVA